MLDTGVFIGMDRRDRRIVALMKLYVERRTPMITSAGVIAQVWRSGAGSQTAVSLVLQRARVFDLTHRVARAVGLMLGASRTRDAIDAHVAYLAAGHDFTVLTSDPDDLLRIVPTLRVERV